MSTPSDPQGSQWQQPGGPGPSPDQPPAAASNYGQPSSPSYGKYGQGHALPTPPPPVPGPGYPGQQYPGQPGWGQQPGQPGWGQQPGQPGWGQPGYSAQQPPNWGNGPTVLQPMS